MHQLRISSILSLLLSLISLVGCGCHPSVEFPPPKLHPSSNELKQVFKNIEASIEDRTSQSQYNTTSFSLEITSSQSTLYSYHHTAKNLSPNRPGASPVNSSSAYRIASITKVFTVLAILQQHANGSLHLDDPVIKYLPKLSGSLPWHDITLRALGSQLSGIPGDLFQSDLINNAKDPTMLGLPPKSKEGLPTCDEYSLFVRACDEADLMEGLRKQKPIFAPAQQPSYCNVGFEILGLVLEKVTGTGYSEYVHAMLREIEVEGITFDKPEDQLAILPDGGTWYWDVELGVQRPTGGLYSSSSALSKFLRYVLTHYNGITTGALNWLHPTSYTYGIHSSYGMPWEIFHTDRALKSAKAVTFVTKSGGLASYISIIIMVPDYDLGITILAGGNGKVVNEIREIVTKELIPAVEEIGQKQLKGKYTGIYTAAEINSTVEISHSPESGLYISKFISNGTDVLRVLFPPRAESDEYNAIEWRLQLVPTLLFAEPKKQKGEMWYALTLKQEIGQSGVWDEFCLNKIDIGRYAGKTLNEIVVWTDDVDKVVKIELPAFDVTLDKLQEQTPATARLWGGLAQMRMGDGVWK